MGDSHEASCTFSFSYLSKKAVGRRDLIQLAENRFVDSDIDDLSVARFVAMSKRHQNPDRTVEAR